MPLAPVRARCQTAGGLHRAAHQSLDTVSSAQRALLSRVVPDRGELAVSADYVPRRVLADGSLAVVHRRRGGVAVECQSVRATQVLLLYIRV